MTRRSLITVAIVLALPAVSCSDDGPMMMPDEGRRPEVLASLNEVILPTYAQVADLALLLVAATDAYAAEPNPTTRVAAQDAWGAAMELFEQAEVMQLGPHASMADAAGGMDLRLQMYAWPSLNRCVIDQDTVSPLHADPVALAAETIDRRGLGGIEYLLFTDTAANTCSPLSPINADGTWALYSSGEIEAQRARHAHTLALIVEENARALLDAWLPDGGFERELTDPSRPGAVYGSAQEGLQAVTDALFYVDTETKDMKLAEPAGISVCTTTICPDARESRHANRSKEHILANLRAFQRLYLGGDPGGSELGFDDLLRDMGAGVFADEMAAHLEEAITAVIDIPGTLLEALTNDIAAVTAAYEAVKRVTDDLKTTFLTVLDLEAPNRAAGDND